MKIPRSNQADYTHEMSAQRREFVKSMSGAELQHVGQYSMDPNVFAGNIEHFIGVVQVPIGLAGPIRVNGEHAQGDFFVPLATTEGTLVASYNRGMKLTRMAGGVTVHVIEDKMNRAPVFVFEDAGRARDFGQWIDQNFAKLKELAESTTSVGILVSIEQFSASKVRWLRFNYACGDAAGQNMVTKATREACQWILAEQGDGLEFFSLAGNLDTDKKHSYINYLHTRGKRVVAEIRIPDQILREVMHTDARTLHAQRKISNIGAIMGGSVNNGAHAANGITAMFMATGQDVANVAESSAAIVHADVMSNGDYYFSVTIPSLIVATHGGGTNLPTQRECLEIMGCHGTGKVMKLAEIIGAVVLSGDLSLSSAIMADEWVSSHENLGRNR
jgi:hydroxymethylglutaryl-CoA reductase (NADPH)